MKEDLRAQALAICKILDDKKAEDIVLLDVAHLTVIADYLVLCNGRSTLQVKGLCDELEEKMREQYDVRPAREDGYSEGRWIVLDYGAVIVHIFHAEEREFYRLERLWMDGGNRVGYPVEA